MNHARHTRRPRPMPLHCNTTSGSKKLKLIIHCILKYIFFSNHATIDTAHVVHIERFSSRNLIYHSILRNIVPLLIGPLPRIILVGTYPYRWHIPSKLPSAFIPPMNCNEPLAPEHGFPIRKALSHIMENSTCVPFLEPLYIPLRIKRRKDTMLRHKVLRKTAFCSPSLTDNQRLRRRPAGRVTEFLSSHWSMASGILNLCGSMYGGNSYTSSETLFASGKCFLSDIVS